MKCVALQYSTVCTGRLIRSTKVGGEGGGGRGREKRENVPFRSHVLDLHARNADFLRDRFGVLDRIVLFFVLSHLLVHDGSSLLDDLVQEDNCTSSRAHTLDQAVIDVLEVFRPREVHELEDFEELGEMQVLLR